MLPALPDADPFPGLVNDYNNVAAMVQSEDNPASVANHHFFQAEFERAFVRDEHSDPVFEKRTVYIPSIVKDIDINTNLRRHFRNDVIAHVVNKVQEVMIEGSGFTLKKINKLCVQIFKDEPLRASGYIPLPSALKNCTKSIINLKNTGEKCFQWSILAAFHYDEVHKRN